MENENERGTLGRRIQEGRRAAGLSQEALGERLEVSRQAVSKWEADGAIPELENLIAMSRLFGVTLGALLGVEEPEPGAGEELTDRELQAVEVIAARCAAGQRRAPWWAWAVGASVALALCGLALVLLQFWGLERRLSNLQDRMGAMEYNVQTQVGAVAGPDASFSQAEDLLECSVELTGADPETETMRLRVSATPREQAADATGRFTAVLSQGRRLSCDATAEQGGFVARNWKVPMDQAVFFYLTLLEGTTSRSIRLAALSECAPEDFRLQVDGGWGFTYSSFPGYRVRLGEVALSIQAATFGAAQIGLAPTAVDLCLYRNRESAPEMVLPMKDLPEDFARAGRVEISRYTGYEAEVALEENDVVVAVVRVRDNIGQTGYTVLDAWERRPEGIIQYTTPPDWTPGGTLKT